MYTIETFSHVLYAYTQRNGDIYTYTYKHENIQRDKYKIGI